MAELPESLLFLGIIPALILIYISINKYEGIYKHKTLFLTFVFGIAAGFIAVLIEYASAGVGLIYVIVLFPVLEQLFKVIILNIGRLQRKRETTIYGLSLGLGFGAIFTPFAIIASNYQGSMDTLALTLIVLWSFSIILLHGATGVLLGYGIYIGELFKFFIMSIVLYMPVTISASVITIYPDFWYFEFWLLPYGLLIYWYATKKVMPKILTDRKRSKKKVKAK
jgi:hypothetical protein